MIISETKMTNQMKKSNDETGSHCVDEFTINIRIV